MRGRRLLWLSPLCVPFTWGQRAGIGTRLHIVVNGGAWKMIKAIFIVKSGSWKPITNVKVISRETWK